jgi:protein SCO1/2
VGFHYAFDRASGEYSHPSAALVLTPKGKVSQYFFGIHFPPDQLAAALARASASRLGTPIEAILLYCFHYDPALGTWTFRILNILRLMGALTVVALGSFGAWAWRRESA